MIGKPMYKIEKNVPLHNSPRNGSAFYKYPFFDMKVGDSFAVPVDPTTALNYIRVGCRITSAIQGQYARRNNKDMKFCMRRDEINKVIRVWRTA